MIRAPGALHQGVEYFVGKFSQVLEGSLAQESQSCAFFSAVFEKAKYEFCCSPSWSLKTRRLGGISDHKPRTRRLNGEGQSRSKLLAPSRQELAKSQPFYSLASRLQESSRHATRIGSNARPSFTHWAT